MTRISLPESLGSRAWPVSAAKSYGLSWDRTANAELARPFHGIRAAEQPRTSLELAQAYFARPRPGQAVTGVHAAVIHGLPIPRRLAGRTDLPLDVAVRWAQGRPRAKGVRARRVRDDLFATVEVSGITLASPELVWLTLANELDLLERVTIGDAIVAASSNYPGDRSAALPIRFDDLASFAARAGKAAGGTAIRDALASVREGVESPWETRMRLAITDAGLPEPVIGHEIRDETGRLRAVLDLAYVDERLDVEYDGEQHRFDRDRWERDIERTRWLVARGWRVIRATRRGLWPDPGRFVEDVRRALGG